MVYWHYPEPAAGSGMLAPYVFRPTSSPRPTMRIDFGLARTTFNGFRAPKP
jgi:hypothetical protein